MTHDRLCIGSRLPEDCVWPAQCRCELIAKVRKDERMSERTRWYSVNEEADFRVAQVRAAALRDAVEAVKTLQEKPYWSDLSHAITAIEALGGER